MSFNLTNVNPNAYFVLRYYPTKRNRRDYEEIHAEVMGVISKDVQTPIRNGRVSVNGTQIKTYDKKNYEVEQELYFMDRFWTITDVQFDINELAPQSAKYGTRNTAIYLSIRSAE